MPRTVLWLVASLAFASVIYLANGSPLKVMSAPNLLRVGTTENIFVECQDCTGGAINVEILVMTHPTKNKMLNSTDVILTEANKFQELGKIRIPAGEFSKDPDMMQYVYLQAKFPDVTLEKVVLVSFQSGYIFIQTDKTIYTPNSRVNYRMFAVTPQMEPVLGDESDHTRASIAIDIVTPENITLPLDQVSLESGIHSGGYQLDEIVSVGLWKVVAKFQSNPQQSFFSEFEVKEYVLPSFEVKLTADSPFFDVKSEELTINIKATYLFGKEVDGVAYVVFGVDKGSLPSSRQRVDVEGGNGVVKLKKEHITQTIPNIMDLVGSSIYVAVSVLTQSGSEMVEAKLKGIKIVTSPYTIYFKKTPKYFKPGMSFDVLVEVLNPDDTPAQRVAVVVDPGQGMALVDGQTASNGFARLTINTAGSTKILTVHARTNEPGISTQASATMVAVPYVTKGNNYIHIGVDSTQPEVGDNLRINLIINRQINAQTDITYLILSRGQLMDKGRFKQSGQVLISLPIVITKDMLPSFRVIAYYHTNDNEVVSDSVWVDVKDSCMGSLKLESTRTDPSYQPRKMFGLKITGDPEATVGLVAVDKGVYVLNNKHRLTQKKIWDIVEKYDTGCTPGGGKDGMGVFYDAGVLFESNVASGTPYRLELRCPAPSRRKRATTIMEVTTSLLSKYQDKLQRDCCSDGMKDIPLSYTCERRSEYIIDGPACVEAFKHCCKEMEKQQADRREEILQLARSEEDDYMDSNDIVSRTKFPESWLWKDIKLPPCPKNTKCDTTSWVSNNVPLQDSITTWQFTGISLSKTHGICVSEPLEVIVAKPFFIDLKLPYSAVRGEQIEVKAILHNYSPEEVTVRVDLIEEENVCSVASKHGKYRQEVYVGAQTTLSVPFIIIPMKSGEFSIEVKAAVKESFVNDGIRKMLRVVPQGVLTKTPLSISLDPTNKGVGGRQHEIMNSKIPKQYLAPNTPTSTHISVTGREQVSALVENAISGNSMGTLISEPWGCGEQNAASMTLPVIAATYLDKTNQWKTVGFQKRAEALQHINNGYTRELTYRINDGSFAVWSDEPGSTWLTAYVVKVFALANNLVSVQRHVICDAIKFLILNTQQPDGLFSEVGYVYSQAMRSGVLGSDSDASMTAFCLIAMQESRDLCAATVPSLPGSVDKAVAYLERRLSSLTNPYAVAMTSYALANENKLNKDLLFNFASSGRSHWPVPGSQTYTLEATAYALLALVKNEAFDEAKIVVRWFNLQQKVGGGYGSTQATIMVYQAVAEYWTHAKEPEYDLDVDILLPGRSKPDKFNFNRATQYTTRTSKIKDINQNVTVTAKGTGEATVKMVSLYYALPTKKASDCTMFNMTVQFIPVKMDENEKIYKLKIEILYKNKDHDATMSILDIGLLTGFEVNVDDLNALSKGRARTISRFENDKTLSERGSLIIYLDKVSHTRPDEISFRINQKLKVGVLQPAAVSVYEYNHKTHCVKFYHPQRRAGELLQLCGGQGECTCAEENCSMQKKGKISNDQRTAKACESTPTSKIDFVYKVSLEQFEDSGFTDMYNMRVLQIIKEGSYDVGPEGKPRTFLSYQHCRESLDLGIGKAYLVMGTSKDIRRDDQNQLYQYVLGENTWIEYWPTTAECQTEEHRHTCLGLEDLVMQYETFGCEQ